ncbi:MULTISPECIES: TetR/AcrR family transcriptional regulator [Mycobacteriaceae]|uniref:TetR/AcrR family transcriptional regulator n=1 Tax=Mycolicibacterium phocaicum TaxID=319706 RepID=A0A7I7ZQK1_9MYCO|nr:MULTISPECIES: TetR/AcrR family transcriptional regulator [Mycolicibacterium]MCX8556469.1 TetR/AcrR family transcriptional regulator [Mycolicibacterium mucogenicum]TLH72847.1 TetR/AcrR family transcriptional regulator [Mycolicibacterium phocaicum]TXH24492.1 MAG: TetR/AcrR family transcriptional regulator [Mycobacterium sp.]BBZ55597.1 putative transcriptional regulator, TetR family protein [Mycolicibacterium phocaicum]
MITEPTTDRGRATVARILEAACVLFARQGVRATTLDEIGNAAGAGRSQLYHFFADKADLVSDVVRFQVDRVLSSVQPSFGEVNTAADLRAWCADAIRAHAASDDPIRCPIGSLVYELDRSDDGPARATLKSGFARWEQVIADALQRVADNGGLLPGTEPVVLAAAFLAAYQGGMLMADVSGDVAPLRHALDTALAAAVGLPTKRVRSR